jgi:hypothetical protein
MKIFLQEDSSVEAVGTVRREPTDYIKAVRSGLVVGLTPAVASGHPEVAVINVPLAILLDLELRPRIRATTEQKTGVRIR